MRRTVARRQREIGVRTALGASRAHVLSLVVREALLVTGLGITVGLAGAAALTRLMGAVLTGIQPLDAFSFTAAPAALLLVALLSALLPARRAAAIEPITALRTD